MRRQVSLVLCVMLCLSVHSHASLCMLQCPQLRVHAHAERALQSCAPEAGATSLWKWGGS